MTSSTEASAQEPQEPAKGLEEESSDDAPIKWVNIIFLPFHPAFKLVILCVVTLKCLLAPLQALYPMLFCDKSLLPDPIAYIMLVYQHLGDPLYAIDTLLHIIHRQVTDEASKREHLPKSALLIVMDIFSILPLFKMLSSEVCPPALFWPNILAFCELFWYKSANSTAHAEKKTLTDLLKPSPNRLPSVESMAKPPHLREAHVQQWTSCSIYRVVDHFSLETTHSRFSLAIGYCLILLILANCIACFIIMLTKNGLCANCVNKVYDWRVLVLPRFPDINSKLTSYIYGLVYSFGFLLNKMVDRIMPNTYSEFVLYTIFMVQGYALKLFVFMPKIFAESVTRMLRIHSYDTRVRRIVDETVRRNPSVRAHGVVERFYVLTWKNHRGLTSMPPVIKDVPTYMQVDIRLELTWAFFLHSPTFRKTSPAFMRWLCEHIKIEMKLPGERFFAGPHCYTHLYYLKSGEVQFLSFDDTLSPMLSVTGGTLFGDISFFLPPLRRKVILRCLTYCEVFVVSRQNILKCLHAFPEDRKRIMKSVSGRIEHAHTLHTCKMQKKNLNRSEGEGISWIKKRWWEIRRVIKKNKKCEIPAEEAPYHCAKYIGQLVLCTDIQLKQKSVFAKTSFPWVLVPETTFVVIWRNVVLITVYLTVILYPPALARRTVPLWFSAIECCIDVVFTMDILMSLVTAMGKRGTIKSKFSSVIFSRFKKLTFILDVLAAPWAEHFVVILDHPEYYRVSQFNRLIRVYMIFMSKYDTVWDYKKDPMSKVLHNIAIAQFCIVYIGGYFLYAISRFLPSFTTPYFYGDKICPLNKILACNQDEKGMLAVIVNWVVEHALPNILPQSRLDLVLGILVSFISYIFDTVMSSQFEASLYLKNQDKLNYQYFVSTITRHFIECNIHPDLLKRLERYLVCHWKYFKGMDILHPFLLKDEPHDIYWKLHGQVAEDVIGKCKAFVGADRELIRELACNAKFMILPTASTLSIFGVQLKNVIWIVNGILKCEYHNDEGELLDKLVYPGQILGMGSVFLSGVSLRTFTTTTDCEILYIGLQDFFKIIRRYPNEWSYISSCVDEYSAPFNLLFHSYLQKHKNYQKKVRDRIFHARQSVYSIKKTETLKTAKSKFAWRSLLQKFVLTNPESKFVKCWITLRTFIVAVSIVLASMRGATGLTYFSVISITCDVIALLDILLKLMLPYYDNRGVVITAFRKCSVHYLTRGFLMDMVGTLPVAIFLQYRSDITMKTYLELNAVCKCAHMYLFTGYFDYLADLPTRSVTVYMMLKWQLVVLIFMMRTTMFFVSECVRFKWDATSQLIDWIRLDTCWVPSYLHIDLKPTRHQLNILFAQSLHMAQCALTRLNLGLFSVNRKSYTIIGIFIVLGYIFWFIICYTKALLILGCHSNQQYQKSVTQLQSFLKEERVEDAVIDRALSYFTNLWIRTKGLNIKDLMNERVGVVFKQDMYFYFYKKTLGSLNKLLLGDETLERQLAGHVTELYFLPGDDIMREMDLTANIYVLHRGKVLITQNNNKIALITKGGIFGQMKGTQLRPVRVTATAQDYTDVLQIPIYQFQELLSDEVKEAIDHNPQAAYDFMALKSVVKESPHNTIQYLLRGQKMIQLPWMNRALKANEDAWYTRWLHLVWFWLPSATAVLSLLLFVVPRGYEAPYLVVLVLFDTAHLVHIFSEFYTLKLEVVGHKCEYKYLKWRILKQCGFYLDAISLVIPIVASSAQNWEYSLFRLLRLYNFIHFHKHFCQNFKTKVTPFLLKVNIVLLLVHALTCGWIVVACREYENHKFPSPQSPVPPAIQKTIDYEEWVLPHVRRGGCARLTLNHKVNGTSVWYFVVPTKWQADYVVALTYIVLIHTHTNMDPVVGVSISQICYKVVAAFLLYLVEVWISSETISAMYTRLQDLYQYDRSVGDLVAYLRRNGVNKELLQSVVKYTNMLWQRQRGNWLPAITDRAPLCLREDIFSSLYMHHLKNPKLFHVLPPYFLRQLVVRLKRTVIFPGKYIVQEGDIMPCIFFIHEGEVEKWLTDASGDTHLVSVLSMNGYFGLVPGLYPNMPYQFSYHTRTVVDLIYLKHGDWQDLLGGYPVVKYKLYEAAKEMKKNLQKRVGRTAK